MLLVAAAELPVLRPAGRRGRGPCRWWWRCRSCGGGGGGATGCAAGGGAAGLAAGGGAGCAAGGGGAAGLAAGRRRGHGPCRWWWRCRSCGRRRRRLCRWWRRAAGLAAGGGDGAAGCAAGGGGCRAAAGGEGGAAGGLAGPVGGAAPCAARGGRLPSRPFSSLPSACGAGAAVPGLIKVVVRSTTVALARVRPRRPVCRSARMSSARTCTAPDTPCVPASTRGRTRKVRIAERRVAAIESGAMPGLTPSRSWPLRTDNVRLTTTVLRIRAARRAAGTK